MNKIKTLQCPERFRKQCLNTVNSYGCRLRYFNQRCLYAFSLKNKEKEIKK